MQRFQKLALNGGVALAAVMIPAHAGARDISLDNEASSRNEPASEDGAATSMRDTGDIVVTARRRAESLQKVPVAVTALSGAKIEQLVINTVQDLNKIAGLTTNACTYARECFEPALRGQGTSFATGQASVVPYFAEVANFEPSYFDLENLQVVKGPQGTLFGETATGGVLLFQPRKPTNELSGYADVQAGNYDYHQFEGAVGGAIIEDKLMVRVAGQYRKRDGFTTGIMPDGSRSKLDKVDKAQWRISAVFRPVDDVELYVLYAGRRTKTNGDSSPIYYADPRFITPAIRNLPLSLIPSLAAGFEFGTGYAPPPGASYASLLLQAQQRQTAAGPRTMFHNYRLDGESKFDGVIGQVKVNLADNLTFKNIFGMYWTSNKGANTDQDGVDLPLLDVRGRFVPGTTSITRGERPTVGGYPARNWRNETQLLGTLFDNRLTWQTGFYTRKNATRDFTENGGFLMFYGSVIGDPAPAATCTTLGVASPCSSMTRASSSSHALYGQVTFAATNRLNLTGGIRQTWASSYNEVTATAPYTVNATSSYFPGQLFPQYVPITGRAPLPGAGIIRTKGPREKITTYTLTADWQVTDDLMLYATHRKGYKGGGVNGNAPVDSPLRTFFPETLEDYELGAKLRFDAGGVRGRASVAAYRDDYKDVQRIVILPNGGGQTLTGNVANARIQGIEFEGSVSLTEWFDVAGTFTITDAKYKNWTEVSNCAATFYYDSCTGLPGSTPVLIDHANGTLDIAGKRIGFTPDRYGDVSKYMWAIQPTVHLDPWVGEQFSITGNIYHKSRFIGGNNPSNSSLLADIPRLTQVTMIGAVTDPFKRPGYTVADVRFDWRSIKGSNFSLSGVVTNIGNKKNLISGTSTFSLNGAVAGQFSEPRLFYLQLHYAFGGN